MKYAFALTAALCLAGCNMMSESPRMRGAVITPTELYPGDSGMIEVEIRDRFNIVDRVVARVVEEPSLALPLRDDGEGGDEKAGDGRWTLKVDVPQEAPSGTFTLEVSAYRKDGQLVEVRDRVRNTEALQRQVQVNILGPRP